MNNKIIISLIASFICINVHGTVFFDTNFGVSGLATITSGSGATITEITTQADGKIVILGMSDLDTSSTIFLARLTVQGSLDETFNASGVVTLQYGANVFARSLAVQSDGKIVIAGYTVVNDVPQLLIARYTSAGAPDATFGSGGIVTRLINQNTTINAIALQTIDQTTFILVTGQTFINQVPCGFIARYNDQGAPDTTFGVDGVVTLHYGQIVTPVALKVQADGKILCAGSVIDGQRKLLLARYSGNGSPDQDFGVQGIVTTSVSDSVDDGANDVLLQADGKIVVAGRSQINDHGRIVVARYSVLGVLDNTFGVGGITITNSGSEAYATQAHLLTDGSLIVSTSIDDVGALLRYSSAGSLDTDFGIHGFITSTLNVSGLFPSCIDASEHIVVGGSLNGSGIVARYRSTHDDFITIASPADGSTITSSTFAMTGRSSQESKTVRIRIGSTVLGTATTDSNGNWNAGASPVVSNGTKTVIAELLNGETVLTSATSGITVTAASDSITMTPASGETVASSTPTLSGTSSRGSQSVKITIDGSVAATVSTDALGAWTYPVSSALKNGSHTIMAQLLVNAVAVATVTNTITVGSYSWTSQPECKNYRVISGSFTTADNPPIILSGSGTACPPTCNFSVSRLSSSRFQINFLPKFLFTPFVVAAFQKTSASSGSVNVQGAPTTTSVVLNLSGVYDQVHFMASSCLG